MNKEEAFEKAKQGIKVSHCNFTKEEYLTIENGVIVFEDGVRCSFEEFWKFRDEKSFSVGWSEFKELEEDVLEYNLNEDKNRIRAAKRLFLEEALIRYRDENGLNNQHLVNACERKTVGGEKEIEELVDVVRGEMICRVRVERTLNSYNVFAESAYLPTNEEEVEEC